MNVISQNILKFAVSSLLSVLATMTVVNGINQAAMTDLNGHSFASSAAALPAQTTIA